MAKFTRTRRVSRGGALEIEKQKEKKSSEHILSYIHLYFATFFSWKYHFLC